MPVSFVILACFSISNLIGEGYCYDFDKVESVEVPKPIDLNLKMVDSSVEESSTTFIPWVVSKNTSSIDENLDEAKCTQHNGDACGCRWEEIRSSTGCEYNVFSNTCVLRKRVCGPAPPDRCRLRGAYEENFYAVGGEVCNQVDPTTKTCKPLETMLAIHFDKKGNEHTSVEGITYQSCTTLPYDNPDNFYHNGDFDRMTFPQEDLILYKYQIYGPKRTYPSINCSTYHIPTSGNGDYELILHTGETVETRVDPLYRYRQSTFTLNGVPIVLIFMQEFYRTPRDSFNLRVNYRIFGKGDKLQMEGYPVTDIETNDMSVPLSFCAIVCGLELENFEWFTGAFAAVKVSQPPCSDGNNYMCGCKQNNNCEYSNGKCLDKNEACKLARFVPKDCLREGSHIYNVYGGLVCARAAAGNCVVEQVIMAVNFGKEATTHKDVNGIDYVTDKGIPVEDPANSKTPEYQSDILNGDVPQEDLQLYQKYIWGKATKGNATPCVIYQVPTAGDGDYEISIKTGHHGKLEDKAGFSYKLNGQFIVQNFKPSSYAPRPKAMDLNAIFKISGGGTKFALKGHPDVDITSADGNIPFELCHGQCKWWGVNTSWQIGAFSVVKFKEFQWQKDCDAFMDQPALCRRKHCRYDCESGSCMNISKTEHSYCSGSSGGCDKYCSDRCVCNSKNCQLFSQGYCKSVKNLACADTNFPGQSCGRTNAFYIKDGVLCRNEKLRGICDIEKKIIALNIAGEKATDSRGVEFDMEKPDSYQDPQNIRKIQPLDLPASFPQNEKPFYERILVGAPSKRESGRCIYYSIPLCEDGLYELLVKTIPTVDTLLGEKTFNIMFGGKYVFAEVDVMRLAGKRFQPIDLILNFVVKDASILIDGVAPYTIHNGSVPLGYCYSECNFNQGTFEIAAFSVTKFSEKHQTNQHCALFNNEFLRCTSADCEYNRTTNICSPRKQVCKMVDSGEARSIQPEILFLLDSTGTGDTKSGTDPKNAPSAVFDDFQRIVNVIDPIKAKFRNAKFGIALFSDYWCHAFEDYWPDSCTDQVKNGTMNKIKDGCFRLHQPLTNDVQMIRSQSQRHKLIVIFSQFSEPGLFGAYLAGQDKKAGWTGGKCSAKIIVIITDDVERPVYDGGDKIPTGDGTDNCQTRLPNDSQFDKVLDKFTLYLLYDTKGPRGIKESYESMLKNRKTPRYYDPMNSSVANIANRLIKIIEGYQ